MEKIEFKMPGLKVKLTTLYEKWSHKRGKGFEEALPATILAETSFVGGVQATGVPTDCRSREQMRKLGKYDSDDVFFNLSGRDLSHGSIHLKNGDYIRFGGISKSWPPSIASIHRVPSERSHRASIDLTDRVEHPTDPFVDPAIDTPVSRCSSGISTIEASTSASSPSNQSDTSDELEECSCIAPADFHALINAANDPDEHVAPARFAALLAAAEDSAGQEYDQLAKAEPLTDDNLHRHDLRTTAADEAWWRSFRTWS